jgi:hypothetical protein
MRRLLRARDLLSRLGVGIVCSAIAAGCGGGSSTSPDRSPNTSVSPNGLFFTNWLFDFARGTTTATVQADWTFGEPPANRDVTREAAWSSSDATTARIDGPGQVSSVRWRRGNTIAFRGTTSASSFESFGRTTLSYLGEALSGMCWIVRGRHRAGLTGDRQILNGHNAGRTAITTDNHSGLFTFDGPFICGPSTMRASKPGYGDTTVPRMWCVDAPQPQLVLTPQ